MQRRTLIKLLAISVAVPLVASSPIMAYTTVYAEEPTGELSTLGEAISNDIGINVSDAAEGLIDVKEPVMVDGNAENEDEKSRAVSSIEATVVSEPSADSVIAAAYAKFGGTIDVEGDVSATKGPESTSVHGVDAYYGGIINVGGSVSLDGIENEHVNESTSVTEPGTEDTAQNNVDQFDTGISVNYGGSVDVKGDVKSDGTGVYSYELKDRQLGDFNHIGGVPEIDYYGVNGLNSEPSNYVHVGGNVEAEYFGIECEKSEIIVDKDVISDKRQGIYAKESSKVEVGGSVKTKDNVGVTAESSEIKIGEDIDSKSYGIESYNSDVTVGGNITAVKEIDDEQDVSAIRSSESKIIIGGSVTSIEGSGIDANDSTVSVGNDITAKDTAIDSFSSQIDVKGNVESTDSSGVEASGRSDVKIQGNVTSFLNGITSNYSNVEIKGNVESIDNCGVIVYSEGTAYIEGDVNARETAVNVGSNSKVTVDGNINSTNYVGVSSSRGNVDIGGNITAQKSGIEAFESSEIKVGDKSGERVIVESKQGSGIVVYNNQNDIEINGDVTGKTSALEIEIYPDFVVPTVDNDENTREKAIVVDGILKATDGSAITIKGDFDSLDTCIPTIVVYGIDKDNEESFINVNSSSSENNEENGEDVQNIINTVQKAINYIIRTNDAYSAITDIEDFREINGFKTMKLNDTVQIALRGGYKLVGNTEVVNIEKNQETGKYNVKLKSILGGITLEVKKIGDEGTNEQGNNQSEVIPEKGEEIKTDNKSDTGMKQEKKDIEAKIDEMPEKVTEINEDGENKSYGEQSGGIIISTVTSTDSSSADLAPLVEGAPAVSRAVSIDVNTVAPEVYRDLIINNIDSTPANGTLRVVTNDVSCLDRNMLEAFARRGNVNMEIVFMNKGKKMRVLIPMGCDITKLLDAKGFCGFLRLADILGAETIG